MFQQRRGIGGDVIAIARGAAVQRVEVAQGVGGQLARQVGRVGAPPPRLLVRMDFDQLTAPVELDRRAVRASQNPLPDKLSRR
ncbi:hypothetical protein [Lentzea flava]|uniref:Uncharacterized protein n=1 Tax=Lentzea flava TaxID=103732 RepID=A0ABQ2US81_9PSEU|nr:hypothetical protein [Lentzea flava]MCP2200917.1 hypothetical protein [Lentzea flava]GGU47078.1 hypothetical protein GCM10010178_44500 [Lentzea flava]